MEHELVHIIEDDVIDEYQFFRKDKLTLAKVSRLANKSRIVVSAFTGKFKFSMILLNLK
jgi:hypothetical protein